jgi:PhnB protein
MGLNIYLNFNGNTKEVVEFYANIFGVPLQQMMFFKDLPSPNNEPLPPEDEHRVMHTFLDIDGSRIMFSDTWSHQPVHVGTNFNISYVSSDEEKIRLYFEKLSNDGQVIMPIQQTFWSKAYGILVDKFGVGWQFNHESQSTS